MTPVPPAVSPESEIRLDKSALEKATAAAEVAADYETRGRQYLEYERIGNWPEVVSAAITTYLSAISETHAIVPKWALTMLLDSHTRNWREADELFTIPMGQYPEHMGDADGYGRAWSDLRDAALNPKEKGKDNG